MPTILSCAWLIVRLEKAIAPTEGRWGEELLFGGRVLQVACEVERSGDRPFFASMKTLVATVLGRCALLCF